VETDVGSGGREKAKPLALYTLKDCEERSSPKERLRGQFFGDRAGEVSCRGERWGLLGRTPTGGPERMGGGVKVTAGLQLQKTRDTLFSGGGGKEDWTQGSRPGKGGGGVWAKKN